MKNVYKTQHNLLELYIYTHTHTHVHIYHKYHTY